MSYQEKYLKYKNKYLNLKKQFGGVNKTYYKCADEINYGMPIKKLCVPDDTGTFETLDECIFSKECLDKLKPIEKDKYSWIDSEILKPIILKPIKIKATDSWIDSKILRCQACNNLITSPEHREKCSTSGMYDVKVSFIDSEFKPMMTFGLAGCTALLMVFFTKDTNIVYKVVLGHHPQKEEILKWFTKYYSEDYNIITIIKTPGNYQKEGERWNMVATYQEYWVENITKDNCKLILEPYEIDGNRQFNSSLYFKMQPGPKYSDIYGTYIDINYI